MMPKLSSNDNASVKNDSSDATHLPDGVHGNALRLRFKQIARNRKRIIIAPHGNRLLPHTRRCNHPHKLVLFCSSVPGTHAPAKKELNRERITV
jgi:hypothetical protein